MVVKLAASSVKLAASSETAKIVKLAASIQQQKFSSEYPVAADSDPRDRQHHVLLFKVRLGLKNATFLIAQCYCKSHDLKKINKFDPNKIDFSNNQKLPRVDDYFRLKDCLPIYISIFNQMLQFCALTEVTYTRHNCQILQYRNEFRYTLVFSQCVTGYK